MFLVNQKRVVKICASLMGFSGLVLIFSALLPIVLYERDARQRYPRLISPLVADRSRLFESAEGQVLSPSSEEEDYTKARNWFPSAKEKNFSLSEGSYYWISIPRLGIKNAKVSLGGEDLAKSLIQYPGTALPGKIGNSVIFGHSILPQFYDPNNYLAIFSTLPALEKRDEIIVDYDGVSYKYLVSEVFEVRPTDVQILDQVASSPYLTLVTCTPPGHPLKPKRLIVRAEIVDT